MTFQNFSIDLLNKTSETIILKKPIYNECNIFYFDILQRYFSFILIICIILLFLKIFKKKITFEYISDVILFLYFILIMLTIFMFVYIYLT